MLLTLMLHCALAAEPPLADDSWRQMYLEATLPDPHLAFNESLVLGFGSGHFYAHDKAGGFAHLGTQAGGLVLAASGLGMGWNNRSDAPKVMIVTGALTFLTSRIIDMVTAPNAAHGYAARRIAEEGEFGD